MDKDPPEKKGRPEKSAGSLLENDRFRSNLLSIVSHELNTPLTGILNALVMLEEKFPAEKEYIPMLRRNSDRLRKCIENLLEISRVDAGTLRVRLSELDMENFLLGRREALKDQLKQQGFSFDTDIEEHLPHVCGDLRRLTHVFDSLVLNAVKFSSGNFKTGEETGKIRVSLTLESVTALPPGLFSSREKKTGMYLLVCVQSSMPSIGESPESFEQLFEPFSPWRDADTRVRDGLGVELAIAKEILLAHEGFIWADLPESVGLKGWKFCFALPLLARVDELDLVVSNRLFTAIGALSKMSLLLLRPEPGFEIKTADEQRISQALQKVLFRSSDTTFWLQDTSEYVILMDDCDHDGAERVATRILATLKSEMPELRFLSSLITGPDEGSNVRELLDKARHRWRPSN